MKTWEIASRMQINFYDIGDTFESEGGIAIINNEGILVWEDTKEEVSIIMNDNLWWNELNIK